MKICKKCGTEKICSKECKACRKIYNATYNTANADRLKLLRASKADDRKDYNATYNAANPEKVKASRDAWRANNQDKIKAYNTANADKSRSRAKAWAEANPEWAKKINSTWKAANPESVRIYHQNRRAKKRASNGKLSKGLSAKLFNLQRGKCACCGKPLGADYHLDHIMPLALGGANEDWNMQLLTQRCNNQKCAKHPIEFMQERGFLI